MNNENLLPGGVPGNKGGGRPKSEIREAARRLHDKSIAKLDEKLENGESISTSDLARVAEVSGKFGMGELTSIDDDLVVRFAIDVAIEMGVDGLVFAEKLAARLKDG